MIRRTFARNLDQMFSGQLFQLLNRFDGSQRRRTLCRIQRDVVCGPFRDELGVHGGEKERATKLEIELIGCLNSRTGDVRDSEVAIMRGKC